MDNFQTSITGNASLVLGKTEQALHPIILIQFSAGPIALVRQRTPDIKPLIIGGRLKDWKNIYNYPIEINEYAFQHINFSDFLQHQNSSETVK